VCTVVLGQAGKGLRFKVRVRCVRPYLLVVLVIIRPLQQWNNGWVSWLISGAGGLVGMVARILCVEDATTIAHSGTRGG
jgi:hypothetical protein